MKILVVGGAGYIGSVCAELLLNEGHDVAIFDNLTEGHRAAVDPRATFIEGDLSDRQSIGAAISTVRPDAVMHFAANALVGESMENPSKYFRNNVGNGLNLLDAMVEARVGRLHADALNDFDAGEPRQAQVDQRNGRLTLAELGDGLHSVRSFAHHFKTVHHVEQRHQSLAHHVMVLHNQNAN